MKSHWIVLIFVGILTLICWIWEIYGWIKGKDPDDIGGYSHWM